VRIETRVGEGTRVTVYLRRAGPAVAEPAGDQLESEPSPRTRRQSCVLVVDDDAVVLMSTLRMMDYLGYAAVAVADGKEALRAIASNPRIDLVLTDFAMPGMNGVELARAIRAERPSLPIIFVTGYGDLDVLRQFGDTPILEKPYAEGDLAAAIGAALNATVARPTSGGQVKPRRSRPAGRR
jgi:CheY-like chemotaxis protein